MMNEAPVCKTYSVCDNIDLYTILQEYESYYYLRFQKYPKICKKSTQLEKNNDASGSQRKKISNRPTSCTIDSKQSSVPMIKNKCNPLKNYGDREIPDLGLTVFPLETSAKQFSSASSNIEKNIISDATTTFEDNFNHFGVIGTDIAKELVVENPKVHWKDIIGHGDAKKILKEAVLYPLQYPELFTGLLGPWKGKSLLAKAVATECNTRLISISPSLVTSKWRGDSEKLIKVLFEVARRNAPSTILIEEIDALIGKRDSALEHEASRRMKTELLIQMDKLVHQNSVHEEKVFILATSNIPW
ncbi:hypothetical protein J437_LFUL009422 [Ladona fulva]|uniref:ATPase AAA-type core domain-containing protein n=1 Tax=Ladona fulva TaxID=123851 RepID=A0A8K0P4T3_LADFU|nr:hypothetical protein J437_LFUL009422 [Ladona fulva]